MALSNAEINQWFKMNPGANDQRIAAMMNEYGIDANQLSSATGVNPAEIQSRYEATGMKTDPAFTVRGAAPAQSVPVQQAQNPQMNFGMGGNQQTNQYQQNPYLTQMGDALTQQVTSNLNRNILPQIRSQAQAVGGFGGSRQGVVEANALNDANQGISNALANLYGTDWTNAQNRGLQQQSLDNSYNLGLGNLGLNAQNSQNSFYTAQRGQDLQQYGLGASLVNQANQGYLNQGQGLYNVGTTTQQAPWGTVGSYQSAFQPFSGLNSSTTTSQSSNPWASALGGAIGGAQLSRLF